ncbi:hypothetical protein [Nocardioides panaciterrulae]|uniref:Putative phage tail protein n=1 Tax=Nocardioides panaciterrulae TaxID=661492 RepID=A0A7Y9E6C8_9ACTN|nr:hypothetical protein [Nocardioides panaciterrulae]NYD41686.1 putative phage tail protein [Nocardioides panaciterrulae]
MNELTSPTRTARFVLGAVASLALLVGAFVLALVAFFALYVGVPAWLVAAAGAAVIIGVVAAFQHVRRAAARQSELRSA